jgi:phage gp29-like protein
MESYINTVVDVLNKQLIEPLWRLNGLDWSVMPKLVAGDIAPHDLKELGSYLRNLNGANIDLSDEVDIINALLENAELPEVDPEEYMAKLEEKKQAKKDEMVMQLEAKAQQGQQVDGKPKSKDK